MDRNLVRIKRRRKLVSLVKVWMAYTAWLQYIEATKKRRSPQVWMLDYLKRRRQNSQWFNVMADLQHNSYGHAAIFKSAVGVDAAMYHYICARIAPLIERKYTNFRDPITVEERMFVTFTYLVTGNPYKTPRIGAIVSKTSVSNIVVETCCALIEVFQPEVMLTPHTEANWKEISDHFLDRWNMPHALGAIDGKHIRIKKPDNSGSEYFNYKKFFSILLFALVDASLTFRYVEVGEPGKSGDSTVFNASTLLQALNSGRANVPKDDVLEGDTVPTPYYILSDSAFALRTWMQKPYPGSQLQRDQRVFNYRLSRARLVVECAFGVLASR